ncbi:MAG: peptidase M15 [Deltaproteobacteria bacterium]|jgi:hypothetical protein|nr:peptidase M15 [Deltaproteobacteria bacterium]MBT4526312.1 peptidase M15 [Deltaproteobacteria bacterium]
MKSPKSVKSLEQFGRTRLSENFFMRDFLYSEISQIESVPNIPDDTDLAVQAGKMLCKKVLEPIREKLGRISIRSAFRSCKVNDIGAKKKFNCANNESNYGRHIWDRRDSDGFMGATACIIVNSYIDYYENNSHDWLPLAWWLHDNITEYASICFFPKYCAFNISWNENPDYHKEISSWIKHPEVKGRILTKKSWNNFYGNHSDFYISFLKQINIESN